MDIQIRDGHAKLNGDDKWYSFDSGTIDIIGPDDRTLFGITIKKDFSIRIDGGDTVKIDNEIYNDKFIIIPVASNCIILKKPLYED